VADFSIKRNDRVPSIAATLTDSLGAPVDLTSSSVKFIMSAAPGGGTPVLNVAATIVSGPAGTVRYDWAVGNTATSGDFVAEWEVTFASSKKQTFPSVGYNTITISPDLDSA
jgi:hypothetical protein